MVRAEGGRLVITRRYRIEGRVQGVGFRAFTVRLARSLGLHGAVRNETDGDVVAIAVGDESSLERFHAGIARGPSFARVDVVEESEMDDPGECETFDVRF
jgi:acylphosphatase